MINSKKAQDSLALKLRLDINNKHSSNNLNDWIFSLFDLKKTETILDLCCGRGNQTMEFAKKCKNGIIYSLDISQESLDIIDDKKRKNIKTILMSLDSIPKTPLKENFFDIIHCAYGLYYAKKPKKIISKSHDLLKKNGTLIIIGPTDNNNNELYKLIEKVYPIDKKIMFTSKDFMNKVVVPEVEKIFSQVKRFYFTNQVTYPTAKSFYDYFKSSTMYKKQFDKKLIKQIDRFFSKEKKLIVTKKVLAVIAKN